MAPLPPKALILGCGYIGRALGRALARQGVDVTGWVRTVGSSEDLADEGITPWIGDVADTSDWDGIADGFDAVIHCASSARGGAAIYRSVYLDGVRQALSHCPAARFLFVSSTSVYGQEDGSAVTEASPAEPKTETGQILREAEEEALREANALVFRVGGIYGPGRGILFERFRQGEAVIEGDGTRSINQAHRDDVVSALLCGLGVGIPPLPDGIYNVCDDEPVSYLTYYGWLAERLGKPMPPFVPPNPNRKRGWTNKRVSNAKLKAAGWKPRFPTFREGLDEALRAL